MRKPMLVAGIIAALTSATPVAAQTVDQQISTFIAERDAARHLRCERNTAALSENSMIMRATLKLARKNNSLLTRTSGQKLDRDVRDVQLAAMIHYLDADEARLREERRTSRCS